MAENVAVDLDTGVLPCPKAEEAGRARTARAPDRPGGTGAMRLAAASWWIVAAAGHLAFGAYILVAYGAATLHGDTAAWNRVWPTGYVPGQPWGNGIVAVHVLLASVVAIGGPLQLIPALRRWVPWFHRWNGRVYMSVAILVGAAGLAMLASGRSLVGSSQNTGVAINGVLLLPCAVLAWQRAGARDFVGHRRWALRLFVLAAGVWFFRIGLAGWIAINGGIAGFDPRTMQGPALFTLAMAEWVVPLLVLEAYLRAERACSAIWRRAVAGLVMVMTCVTAYCVYRATMGMWWPSMHLP